MPTKSALSGARRDDVTGLSPKRRVQVLAVLVLLVYLLGAGYGALAESASSCLVRGEMLIVIEALQGGIAGQSGERTSIAQDGCFTIDRVLNGKVMSRLRSGRLGTNQLLTTRAAIDAADIASLPDRAGTPSAVNEASMSVTIGGVKKMVVAPSGTKFEDVDALGRGSVEDPVIRLARMASRVRELTGN